jgi:D-amino-acid dehydrogenase
MIDQTQPQSGAGKTVVVIGAGILGVSTAIWAQRAGHHVILVDREGPAAGASAGNAGLLASSAVVPVNTPDLWTKAPGMLLDPESPLFLRWSYLPRMIPWLAQFMAKATDKQARATARALYPIIGDSLADHQALAAGTGAERYIVPTDYLYMYKDRAAYQAGGYAWDIKTSLGFIPREVEGAELRALEPALSEGAVGFAAAVPNHGRISDPAAYVRALADHVVANGGQLIKGEVQGVARENGHVTGVRVDGDLIACDRAVITAGAWSGPLTRDLGLKVPLDTERGYHIELWNPSQMTNHPSMISAGAFVITPMEGRLRLAGIVELGGIKAGPSRAPFNLLRKHLARVMPDLTWEEETEWMGFRPTLPDALPVIDAVPGVKGAFVGFGHQHVGLTGGSATGRLLAQMLSGQVPNLDLTPYSLSRFGNR